MLGARTNTLVIILGASEWPKSRQLPSSDAFKRSASAIRAYFTEAHGLGVPSGCVFDLFDDPRSQGDQDDDIGAFLEKYCDRQGQGINLILYYTGHGAFTEGDQKYCFVLRASRIGALGASGYRVSSLARTLNRLAPLARRFVIIDACFAGAAMIDFMPQSDAASMIESETMDMLVDGGTALLCAASSSEVALAPVGGKHTMFTDALLTALRTGRSYMGQFLSFDDLRTLIESHIRETFRDQAVRPEMHIPDQRRGNISRAGLFPNKAWSPPQQQGRPVGLVGEFAPEKKQNEPLSQKTIKFSTVEKKNDPKIQNQNAIKSNSIYKKIIRKIFEVYTAHPWLVFPLGTVISISFFVAVIFFLGLPQSNPVKPSGNAGDASQIENQLGISAGAEMTSDSGPTNQPPVTVASNPGSTPSISPPSKLTIPAQTPSEERTRQKTTTTTHSDADQSTDQPYEAREFIVYFEFDSSKLTSDALDVISAAADYARTGHAKRVVVIGHDDSFSTAEHSLLVSERRAKAIVDRLTKLGVDKSIVTIDWRGSSAPAVSTGDGVKEPLNRRATIDVTF